MNADELYEALAGRKIILHRGAVFFNTRDWEDALEWERKGARIVPWYDQEQMDSIRARRAKLGTALPIPGWEVHVLGMVDDDWVEGPDGDQLNVAPELFRERCREALSPTH